MGVLRISPAWKNETGGETKFQVSVGSVEEILLAFADRFPNNRRRVIGPDGRVYRYFSVFMEGLRVPYRDWPTTVVGEHTEIDVLPALAGG